MEERYSRVKLEEDEIDLYECWQVLARYKKLILTFTFSVSFIVLVISIFKVNIYKSKAVILPVKTESPGVSSIASRFGGLAQIAGISLPPGGSSVEIMALLKSDILKAEVIKRYKLLPILFYKQWDKENSKWKQPGPISKMLKKIRSIFKKNNVSSKKDNTPSIDDGIEAFDGILRINEDKKLGTISISVEYPDPEIASKLVQYMINALRMHMSEEAIRIAKKNKELLEKELIKTTDPTIQQKLYSLIAKQVETITMAKVNENFAFKVIDPPRVPNKKYKPKRSLIVIIAFTTALFFSIFLAFFLEYIKNAKDRAKGVKNE